MGGEDGVSFERKVWSYLYNKETIQIGLKHDVRCSFCYVEWNE